MPHIHCLGHDWSLASAMIANHVLTALYYTGLCWVLAMREKSHTYDMLLKKTFFVKGLAVVMITCGINYIWQVVVIFYPLYWWQVAFLTLNTVASIFSLGQAIAYWVIHRGR